MKKTITLFLLFSFCSVFSQETVKDKFSVDYFGGFYSNFRDWKENGAKGGYEFSYNPKSILYSVNFSVGLGISQNLKTKDGYIQAFFESDLLIGKKFSLSNSIKIIPQVGVGYLHLTNHFQEEPKNLIGLPIQVKILFFDNDATSFGLINHLILNNVQNNYSLNFTANFKF